MAGEEGDHRRRLIELYQQKFGEHIPLIRRHDIRGFIQHPPIWQIQPLGLDKVRDLAENMELETLRFYRRAASRSEDASIRKLLGDLAEAEVAARADRRPVWSKRTCPPTCAPRRTRCSGACSCCA